MSVIPIGINAQEIQQAKVFRVQFATDIAKLLVSHPNFVSHGHVLAMTSKEVAKYAFEVAEYFSNEILGKGNEDNNLVH